MSNRPRHTVLILLLIISASPGARADVIDSSAAGFTVRNTVAVKASPADAYRQLTGSIGEWWNPEHTYTGNARNMTITTQDDGCFCEKLDNGGVVRHMTVVYASPGATLRLTGGLGPLQELAVAGTLTWNLTPAAGGTTIEMTYTAGGYSPKGLNTLAPVVDMVLRDQLVRLKNYLDTGAPDAAGTPAK